jgi:hypothetical protein
MIVCQSDCIGSVDGCGPLSRVVDLDLCPGMTVGRVPRCGRSRRAKTRTVSGHPVNWSRLAPRAAARLAR